MTDNNELNPKTAQRTLASKGKGIHGGVEALIQKESKNKVGPKKAYA